MEVGPHHINTQITDWSPQIGGESSERFHLIRKALLPTGSQHREYLSETGLYYYVSKQSKVCYHLTAKCNRLTSPQRSEDCIIGYYDPSLSMFYGVDPLADHPNQVDKSPYAYAWNNPVILTDPDGRCPMCPFIGAWIERKIIWEGGKSLYRVLTTGTKPASPSIWKQTDAILSQDANVSVRDNLISPIILRSNSNDQKSKGTQTPSKTLWKAKDSKERIDVENPNPSDPNRKGQIQYHDKNNRKYLYDSEKSTFRDFKTGQEMSKTQTNNLLNRDEILKGLDKAKKYFDD